ncbi:MAG: hypothetical protein CVV44_10905 [Spirochaetae bacterium HGW-Spirochaetae-1]|jgi:TolB-like protein/tetratricopeptide (TPR) repeat protein|nr:MAG: hypothetical protein CVV44_10905 [Spirochaetae bacterium HGW-Spirochaetae-1]
MTGTLLSVILLLITCPLFAENMTILVHPFKNTGEQKYSWISPGMTDTVISDLWKIRNITVISETDRLKAIQELELSMTGLVDEEKARKTGKILGADIIFTGSYLVLGKRIRVNAHLVDVTKGSMERSVKIDGTIEKIFDLQDRIVLALVAETEKIEIADIKRIHVSDNDKNKILSSTKPDLRAYERYSKGLEILHTNPRGALRYFKEAIKIQSDYAEALAKAGLTAGYVLNLYDEGFGYLAKLDILYREKGETNTREYAVLMQLMGMMYHSRGETDRALDSYSRSMKILYGLGLEKSGHYAVIMANMANVYLDKKQPHKALEYFTRSGNILDSLGRQNTGAYAILLMSMGNIYYISQPDKSLEYFLKSSKIQDNLGLQNTSGYASLMTNMGNAYSIKKMPDRALMYYSRSKKIQETLRIGNTDNYAVLMSNMGIIFMLKKKPDTALEYFLKSKETKDRLKLQKTMGYASVMEYMGAALYAQGRYDTSLAYYLRSAKLYEIHHFQNTAQYAHILFRIAEAYEKREKRKQAGDYYRKAYNSYTEAGYTGELRGKALNNAERLQGKPAP